MSFSIYFFSADGSATTSNKYDLFRECTQFADRNGFEAVWIPERHFSPFGGLYPNPSVLGAAAAMLTEQIQIRAGSVVLPLQDPLRVAEEWSVVDNLSDGRVAVACASGWHPNDFVLAPDNYANRRQIMLERVGLLRKLWRGEAVILANGLGEQVETRVLPRPIQVEIPIWLAAHSDETFKAAGQIGANIVTNIWKTDLDYLSKQIEMYRNSRRVYGDDSRGIVTLMIHTLVGDSDNDVREKTKSSYGEYRHSFLSLRDAQAEGSGVDFDLQDDERDRIVAHATNQLLESRGLMGTPDRCRETLHRIQAVDIDEVACLIDFGVDADSVIAGLKNLVELRNVYHAFQDA